MEIQGPFPHAHRAAQGGEVPVRLHAAEWSWPRLWSIRRLLRARPSTRWLMASSQMPPARLILNGCTWGSLRHSCRYIARG
jgi:hypothetical protein